MLAGVDICLVWPHGDTTESVAKRPEGRRQVHSHVFIVLVQDQLEVHLRLSISHLRQSAQPPPHHASDPNSMCLHRLEFVMGEAKAFQICQQ